MNPILLYIASAITGIWGVAHLFATKGVVAGFGNISTDNRRIITMEWIVEGIALLSIGAFVATATVIQPEAPTSSGIYAVAIITLVVLAIVSLFTGFRIAFLPFRLCPFIFSLSAVLIGAGAWL
ncbi:hypothetical protein [Desulfobacula sp.]|uniref:hypothetical protein n=1 Tax=Desulfobacula sp. TaxID=2593537 RepID=UPI0026319DEB|nr:hypothetical protein [Desulfobacula sp.]